MGYLPESVPIYADMKVLDFLLFIAEIRGYTDKEKYQRVIDIVEKIDLNDVLKQTVGTLSKGYKCRVGLAQALLHDPEVIILDEPTDGLDPNQKQEVRNSIKDIAAEKIIVISTHLLDEVEAICNRVIIINDGKIVVDSTPTELMKRYSSNLQEIFRNITQVHQKHRILKFTMKNILILFKRELCSYFQTPIAYIFLIIFLFLSGLCTFYIGDFFTRGQADLIPFFSFHPWLYMIFIPALTMRTWSDERFVGTIELLFTLPVTTFEVVISKFLATWSFLVICIIIDLTNVDHC